MSIPQIIDKLKANIHAEIIAISTKAFDKEIDNAKKGSVCCDGHLLCSRNNSNKLYSEVVLSKLYIFLYEHKQYAPYIFSQ